LKYLKKDVLGLLEVLNKVSLYYFKEFRVNIPKYMTLPSLAVFGFNLYDEKYKIKMIKGPLANFIREAYFGEM
jgi:DNA polymerase type B, organellar and viral